jgi:hypothetical protein
LNGRYILVDRKPVPEPDLLKWAAWIKDREKSIVAQTEIGNIFVSTIFLGLDYNFLGNGEPILFETMAFKGGESLDIQERCCTWEQAEAQHRLVVDSLVVHN